MRFTGSIVILLTTVSFGLSQKKSNLNNRNDKIGKFYSYWGWNLSGYSGSDINFKGDNYDFTLKNVAAEDRQSPFNLDYFNPTKVSIPQYNFRFGYYLKENWDISIGIDHMKYVVIQNQLTKITGNISGTGTIYDGTYSDDNLVIIEDFLLFEHTDGLNYANIEIRKSSEILTERKVQVDFIRGIGLGALVPKTNTTLLDNQRYDEFHLAGYGAAGVVGFNVLLYKSLFAQAELKGGFINMPDIRTTSSTSDKASQHFFFYQYNIVFGATFGQ